MEGANLRPTIPQSGIYRIGSAAEEFLEEASDFFAEGHLAC
jgi:hypothetical protein